MGKATGSDEGSWSLAEMIGGILLNLPQLQGWKLCATIKISSNVHTHAQESRIKKRKGSAPQNSPRIIPLVLQTRRTRIIMFTKQCARIQPLIEPRRFRERRSKRWGTSLPQRRRVRSPRSVGVRDDRFCRTSDVGVAGTEGRVGRLVLVRMGMVGIGMGATS